MSIPRFPADAGLREEELRELTDVEVRVRTFRILLGLSQRLRYLMDARLRPAGLTSQQAALLTVIDLVEGAPSLVEAAGALATSHQNVKQLALSLERKGFLKIAVDTGDRRVRRLRPTAKSRRFWARRDADDHSAVASWLSALDPAESRQLCWLLSRAFAGVGTAYHAARSGGDR